MTASDNPSELDRIRAEQAARQARAAAVLNARRAAGIDERIAGCTPYQAAVVAALAARRTTAIGDLRDDEFRKLIQSAERMNQAYLLSTPTKTITTEVSARLEEILGSDDFPTENPGGSEGYFRGAAISIACLRDAWTLQDLKHARSALDHAFYSFASQLGMHEAETACQSRDLEAVTALGEPITPEQFAELAAAPASLALGQAYRARVAEIIAAGQ
ncbi:hypothetical protein [Catenulispora rubra]|uniref:hypothetical protein n=1 Tax=Catenulispora rubra TaxID=280293 RepID=UPI0018921E48|nr:hypothetical protein [Catenulispora rubra]